MDRLHVLISLSSMESSSLKFLVIQFSVLICQCLYVHNTTAFALSFHDVEDSPRAESNTDILSCHCLPHHHQNWHSGLQTSDEHASLHILCQSGRWCTIGRYDKVGRSSQLYHNFLQHKQRRAFEVHHRSPLIGMIGSLRP